MLPTRQPFNREAAWPLGAALSALAFFRYYTPGAADPALCGFLWLTGLRCPFCGMTRALCSIGHGDFGRAVALHALSPAVFALTVAVAAVSSFQLAGYAVRAPWADARFWYAAAALFGAFGALRVIIPW